ncbi:MAG TPA: hypothetical protein VFR37_25940 [Longimicrobium sp.]|nr:hypothetical protein [Longimicrobium sp.]
MAVPPPDPALEGHPPFDCARCGTRVRGERPDDARWCTACRRALIERAARLAWVPAIVVALLYLVLLMWSGLLGSPMMAFWLALGAVLAFVAFKVGRRVFFDVLRGRATGDGKG